MTSDTRATLLERLRDGAEPLAWEEFFQRYWPPIYALARWRGCSQHTAEEVVQDVMLKVFERKDLFQYDPGRGRFRDWLATVVRNQVAECRRRPSGRVRPQGGDGGTRLAEVPSDDGQPYAAWEAAFEQALLAVLLDVVRREMEPRAYLAFELLAVHQHTGTKVAKITGLTRNAVYKTRRRVLKRLRELGAAYRDDGQLHDQIKQALQARPGAAAERSLVTRLEKTLRSR